MTLATPAKGRRVTTRSIAFMDESGPLGDTAHRILDRAISAVPGGGPGFEFKFNSVTGSSRPFHLELIDAFLAQPDYWQGCFSTVWEAYLSYAKLVVTNNVDSDEEVCVIADYLGKPKNQEVTQVLRVRDRQLQRQERSTPRPRVQHLHAGLVLVAADTDRRPDSRRDPLLVLGEP